MPLAIVEGLEAAPGHATKSITFGPGDALFVNIRSPGNACQPLPQERQAGVCPELRGLEDEVQVLIDQHRLAQLQLSTETVIQRLAQENVNISGGRIEEGSQRYLVRTINQFGGLDEMRELLIATGSGVPVRLKDVATVEQGYKEREAIIRVDGNEAVELAIYKEGDANTVAVADALAPQLERLREDLPEGAALRTIEDQSQFIRQALHEVRNEALMGGALAIQRDTHVNVIGLVPFRRERDRAHATLERVLGRERFRECFDKGAAMPAAEVHHLALTAHIVAGDTLRRREERYANASWSTLTPRQQKIADLVSQGLTNQQVAGKVHSSRGAVEQQLTVIYRTLGVTDRTALTEWIQRMHDGASTPAGSDGRSPGR